MMLKLRKERRRIVCVCEFKTYFDLTYRLKNFYIHLNIDKYKYLKLISIAYLDLF